MAGSIKASKEEEFIGKLVKLILVLLAIGALVKYVLLAEKDPRDQLVDYAVKKINSMSGQMVDKQTLIKGAYSSSRGLVINYQLIDFQRIAFDRAALNQQLLDNAKRKNCGKKEITDVLALDIAVNYVYFNAVDKKIAEVIIDKNTCR